MIMRGTTPRALSAAGYLAVLGLECSCCRCCPSWAQEPQEQQPRPTPPRGQIDERRPETTCSASGRRLNACRGKSRTNSNG